MLKVNTILLISERLEKLSGFVHALQDNKDFDLLTATAVEEGISIAEYHAPALIIVDEQIGALSGLDLVRRLIKVNAFLDTIVISSKTDEDFHLHSEGLGILARLSFQPGKKEADGVFDLLNSAKSILGPH